jgi:hypothetical protein
MVRHTQNNKNIRKVIERILESETDLKIVNNMSRILLEDPLQGLQTDPLQGLQTDPLQGLNGNNQNRNQNRNQNQNQNNSNVTNRSNIEAGTAEGFPKCILNITNQSGSLNTQKQWVVNANSVTYTFSKDGKFTTSDNSSGTWSCNGDNDVRVTYGGTNTNQQTSGGDWATGFPNCVTSFERIEGYGMFHTVGKDNRGVEVDIYFTKTPRQGGNYLAVSRPVGVKGDNGKVNLLYNCNNGLTITDNNGVSYTVGPVGMGGNQASNLTPDQSETYDMVKETNDYLGLKIILGNYRLNTVELTQATEAIISGINSKYRGNGFGYYATFLENLIDFYTSMGEKYQRYVTVVNDNFTQLKSAITTATNELAKTSNQSNWNPLTNPPQQDIMNYTEVKFDKAPFTVPFTAYVIKGQNMTTAATTNIDKNLSAYMSGNTLTAEFCKTTISKLLDCIQYQETGLFKKKAESVTSCEAFEIGELKAMKQVVANCARKRIITDRNQISALSDEGLEDRYKVSFASMKSMDQPPLQ